MITIKLLCNCGQKYAFEAEPINGRMAQPVKCPSCGADGTAAANQIIAEAQPQPTARRTFAAAAAAHDDRGRQEAQKKRRQQMLLLAGGLAGLLLAGGFVAMWMHFVSSPKAGEFVEKGRPDASTAGQASSPDTASGPGPELPANLREALVLHYDFDADPDSGTIVDKSGHGHEGRAVNVQWQADGHRGGAVRFGLSDSYITVPNKDDLNPPHLTLSAWIKTSYADNVWRRIIDKCYAKGFALSEGGDQQQWHHKGKLEWETGVGAGGLSQQRLDDGQWHHVAATYDGVAAKLYMDGWPVDRPAHKAGELKHTDYDLTIGANRSNPNAAYGEVGASFNGLMDDVMMFNRALSDDEIQTVFKSQGGMPGPRPPASAAPPPAPGSAAERLKQLKDLFDQGKIDRPTYEQKKAEILKSL